jgi:tRNA pseudouridine55 synthase
MSIYADESKRTKTAILKTMQDRIILIDKPASMTSFGVVARLRRVLSKEAGKKIKVGHTGTLDPFATGLMIIVVGKETKNATQYSKLDKVYEATIHLGQTSSTGDPEGEVMSVTDRKPTQGEVEEVVKGFVGEIEQRPPIYSAIKINGQRAYKLARKGGMIDMPLRKVMVYSLEIMEYSYPELKIQAHVSSGTYIRTLAEDIGKKLDTGAFCTQLRRTKIANWTVEDARVLQYFGIDE